MSINRSIKRVNRKTKRAPPVYGANTPVCNETCVEFLALAKEIHQHNVYPHVLLVVQDDDSHLVLCLSCGGSSKLSLPTGSHDEEGFQLFKTFHMNCPEPKAPVGLFNADVKK